jgi:hypothetical protein
VVAVPVSATPPGDPGRRFPSPDELLTAPSALPPAPRASPPPPPPASAPAWPGMNLEWPKLPFGPSPNDPPPGPDGGTIDPFRRARDGAPPPPANGP